jgi:hypothetical protein
MISVIHDNIINKTMIMFEHVFVDLNFRFHGCNQHQFKANTLRNQQKQKNIYVTDSYSDKSERAIESHIAK